jgi:hypothetical protein
MHALGHRDGDLQQQVSVPRVPDDPCGVPAKRVEDRQRVRDLALDLERSFQRRRCEPALLVGGELKAATDLVGETVGVDERYARPAVGEQTRGPPAPLTQPRSDPPGTSAFNGARAAGVEA